MSSINATFYVQLHSGDPGVNGTDNVVAIGRQPTGRLGWMAESAGFSLYNRDAIAWLGAAAGNATFFSIWDAAASGHFITKAELPASESIGEGDRVRFLAGELRLLINPCEDE